MFFIIQIVLNIVNKKILYILFNLNNFFIEETFIKKQFHSLTLTNELSSETIYKTAPKQKDGMAFSTLHLKRHRYIAESTTVPQCVM